MHRHARDHGLLVQQTAAQELAPHAVATASGMLLGFATGAAGVLYIGIGHLQDVIGLTRAMAVGYLAIVPGALLAAVVLGKARQPSSSADETLVLAAAGACTCGAA